MDWDLMLSDLESSFDAERRADWWRESAELAEAEHASIEVVDRLRGSVGRPVHLRTRGGLPVDGVIARVEPTYVLVDEGRSCRRSSRWPRWRRSRRWPVRLRGTIDVVPR